MCAMFGERAFSRLVSGEGGQALAPCSIGDRVRLLCLLPGSHSITRWTQMFGQRAIARDRNRLLPFAQGLQPGDDGRLPHGARFGGCPSAVAGTGRRLYEGA